MEQTTLKYLRILIPGIITLLGMYPIYNHYFKEVYDLTSLDLTYVTYFSLIIGATYYQLNIRFLVTYISLKLIRENILDKLIKTYDKPVYAEQRNKLKQDNKFLHIFYKITDADDSLKVKTNNVYFNGLFWTSTADSFLLSLIFGGIFYFYLTSMNQAKALGELFFGISFFSLILHVISVIKHIILSNEQLGYIEFHNKDEVSKMIDSIIQGDDKTQIENLEEKPKDEQVLHELPKPKTEERPKNN